MSNQLNKSPDKSHYTGRAAIFDIPGTDIQCIVVGKNDACLSKICKALFPGATEEVHARFNRTVRVTREEE